MEEHTVDPDIRNRSSRTNKEMSGSPVSIAANAQGRGNISCAVDLATKGLALPELFPLSTLFYSLYFYVLF